MENNNLKTQVFNLVILDKSGSMTSIAKAAIEGFNETVGGIRSAQKQFAATQEHYVSLLPFCACSMEYVYDCVPVEMVANLTSRDYQPCCSTPLYDAMGKGITDLFEKTRKMENASVVVTIITDGMENASKKYSGRAIKDLVDKMSKEALAVKRAEQAFDRKRRTIGLFGGPILALLVFLTPIAGLTVPAHKLLAIMVLVAIWWITEPVPIPVTSLIGPTLAVVTGVVPVGTAYKCELSEL